MFKILFRANKNPLSREDKGLESAFREIFPIESSNGDIDWNTSLTNCMKLKSPLNDELECKKRGKTYSASLKVRLRLTNKKAGNEIQESLVYFGEVPLNDSKRNISNNGAERVVVSQLHRSPGVSFDKEVNLQIGKDLFVEK